MKNHALIFSFFFFIALPFVHAQNQIDDSDAAIETQICHEVPNLNDLWLNTYTKMIKIPNVQNLNCDINNNNLKLATTLYLLDIAGKGKNPSFLGYIAQKATGGLTYDNNVDVNILAQADFINKKINLSDLFFQKNIYYRTSILFHESRHLDLSGDKMDFPHVKCTFKGRQLEKIPHSELSDKLVRDIISSQNRLLKTPDGCDEAFYNRGPNMGAYSYQVIFLRTLYDRTDLPIEINRDAVLYYIKGLLWGHFNEVNSTLYDWFTNPEIYTAPSK